MKNVQVCLVGEQSGGAIQGLRVPPPFDHLILLHGGSDASRVAARAVRSTAETYVHSNEIELFEIDPFNMDDVLAQVIAVRKRDPNGRITVNLSGGTNIMAGAALVGCFILGAEGFYIKFQRGGDPRPLEDRVIRLSLPRVALEDVKGSKLEILHALIGARGVPLTLNQGDVARKVGKSPQLVSIHVRKLARWGLLSVEVAGIHRRLTLTSSGRLFAQLAV